MLKLSDNDFVLFRYLFEHQYLPERFILNYLWKNSLSESYRKKRLWMLRGGKQQREYNQYIKKTSHAWLTSKIYRPTRFLLKVIKNNDSFFQRFKNANTRKNNYDNEIGLLKYKERRFLKYKKKIGIARFEHDVAVQRSRFLLENWGYVENWISQRYIDKQHYLQRFEENQEICAKADGVCNLKSNNDIKIHFELERSAKQPKQYEKKFDKLDKQFSDSDEDIAVIWCYYNDNIKRKILDISYKYDVKHFLLPAGNLLEDLGKTMTDSDDNKYIIDFVKLENENEDEFKLKELDDQFD